MANLPGADDSTGPAAGDEELASGFTFTWFDTEYFLLVPVLVISAAYTYAARTYAWDARVFPQASAAVVLALSLLVLFQKLDAGATRNARAAADRVGSGLSATGVRASLAHWRATAETIWGTNAGYTVVLTAVFLLVTPTVGLIITAPVFTFFYLRRFDFSTAFGVILSVVVLGYVYLVMVGLNLARYLGGILY